MTSPLHIHLLGGFSITSDDRPVTAIDWPRLQSLLAYLILHRDIPQSRTHLAFLLWPDSTEEQAHTNLRHLVHRLRHSLPDANAYLRVTKQTLHWQPLVPWLLDVAEFEQALAAANQAEQREDLAAMRLELEKSVQYYQGDLLSGLYDEWLLPERERLRQMFLIVLERLLLCLEKQRQYSEAIGIAQQLLQFDPLHEAMYRHLMRLYASNGDRAAALRTYHSCVSILQRELGIEPNPPTQEAYQRLLQKETASPHSPSPATPLASIAPFIGRQAEWQHLQHIWQRSLAGHPGIVVLSGEAGIGKTRLAEEFVACLDRQGIATANSSCYPAEGELAYAPITTWLRSNAIRAALSTLADPWYTEVARFIPEMLEERPGLPRPGPLRENWQRQRLFEGLARAVFTVHQPLLLLLEDLHWCDRESLQWLHYLLRYDSHAKLLVVGTVRPEELTTSHPLNHLLKTLPGSTHLTELTLLPLTADETTTLATHIANWHLDSQQAADLYQDTEGNPLFIVETLRMRAGRNNGWQDRSTTISQTIQTIITARLEHLSLPGQELVNQAAVLGRAFTFDVLAQASSLDEDTLVQGVDELWRRRILREQGTDAYEFSHDKLRDVAYTALSKVRSRLLHRRAAQALEVVHAQNLDNVSGILAAHFEQAGLIDRAITYYQRAAEVAQHIYANTDAIHFYQQIVALLTSSLSSSPHWQAIPEVGQQIHERLGDLFALTAQLDEARNAYQEALFQAPTNEHLRRAYLQYKIAQTWKTQRQLDEALQGYSQAEATLMEGTAERTPQWWQMWIDIQNDRLEIHYWQAQVQEMMDLVDQMRPVVTSDGTAAQQATFYERLFMMTARQTRYGASEDMLEYARLSLAARLELGNDIALAWTRFEVGFAALWCGKLNEAEEQLQEAQRMSEQIGDATLQSRNVTYLTVLARKRGQVEATRQFAAYALERATVLHLPEYIGAAKAHLAWVAWREGKLAEAQTNALAALELWRSHQIVYMFQWTALWPLIGIAFTENRLIEAIDYTRFMLVPEQQALPPILNSLIEAAIASRGAGQLEEARTHLLKAITIAQEQGYL